MGIYISGFYFAIPIFPNPSLSLSLPLSLSLSHIMVLDWSPLSSKSDARGPQIALPGYRLKMEKETSSLIVFEIKL